MRLGERAQWLSHFFLVYTTIEILVILSLPGTVLLGRVYMPCPLKAPFAVLKAKGALKAVGCFPSGREARQFCKRHGSQLLLLQTNKGVCSEGSFTDTNFKTPIRWGHYCGEDWPVGFEKRFANEVCTTLKGNTKFPDVNWWNYRKEAFKPPCFTVSPSSAFDDGVNTTTWMRERINTLCESKEAKVLMKAPDSHQWLFPSPKSNLDGVCAAHDMCYFLSSTSFNSKYPVYDPILKTNCDKMLFNYAFALDPETLPRYMKPVLTMWHQLSKVKNEDLVYQENLYMKSVIEAKAISCFAKDKEEIDDWNPLYRDPYCAMADPNEREGNEMTIGYNDVTKNGIGGKQYTESYLSRALNILRLHNPESQVIAEEKEDCLVSGYCWDPQPAYEPSKSISASIASRGGVRKNEKIYVSKNCFIPTRGKVTIRILNHVFSSKHLLAYVNEGQECIKNKKSVGITAPLLRTLGDTEKREGKIEVISPLEIPLSDKHATWSTIGVYAIDIMLLGECEIELEFKILDNDFPLARLRMHIPLGAVLTPLMGKTRPVATELSKQVKFELTTFNEMQVNVVLQDKYFNENDTISLSFTEST
eukprot:Nk52_evm2s106 gene=Nk52_evmTU2s106